MRKKFQLFFTILLICATASAMQKDHHNCPNTVDLNGPNTVRVTKKDDKKARYIQGWILNSELLVPCKKYPNEIKIQNGVECERYTDIYCKVPSTKKDWIKPEELYEDRGSLFYRFK
jgi:hypothetical protein